jgi:hypothetical protein
MQWPIYLYIYIKIDRYGALNFLIKIKQTNKQEELHSSRNVVFWYWDEARSRRRGVGVGELEKIENGTEKKLWQKKMRFLVNCACSSYKTRDNKE